MNRVGRSGSGVNLPPIGNRSSSSRSPSREEKLAVIKEALKEAAREKMKAGDIPTRPRYGKINTLPNLKGIGPTQNAHNRTEETIRGLNNGARSLDTPRPPFHITPM